LWVIYFCPLGVGSTDPIESGSNPDPQPWPQVWQPRVDITLERLESKLGGPARFKELCPMLFHLVKEEPVLRELTHLPQLLQLATFVTTNFNRKFETGEVNRLSAEAFLVTHCGAGDRLRLEPLVKTFFAVLHRLKAQLYAFNWLVSGISDILT
jgi:hypothetical protein